MKVKNITYEKFEGDVYNFHSDPDENYFADNLLVHNCYKENGGNEEYHMSFEDFKKIFHKMPRTLTQIAFGLTDTFRNPDFINMISYCRNNPYQEVIPNFTTHGLDITEENAKVLSKYCGAVAISYDVNNKNKIYEAFNHFYMAGMNQVNMHYVLSKETLKEAYNVINDIAEFSFIKGKVNAIVFLQYKPKGRGSDKYTSINIDEYKKLIKYCEFKEINYGFDSCSAPLAMKSLEGTNRQKDMELYAEPCESSLFSSYINVHGDFFPCSFTEGIGEWKEGLSVLECNDFIKDIWKNEKVEKFRKKLLNSSKNCICVYNKICRSCPVYSINGCKK